MAGRGGGGFLVGLPVEVVMLLCSVQQAQRLGCLLFVPRLSASRICHAICATFIRRLTYLFVQILRVVQPCHIECQLTQIETRTCTRTSTWWCYGG